MSTATFFLILSKTACCLGVSSKPTLVRFWLMENRNGAPKA